MCERSVSLEQLLPLLEERLAAGQSVTFTPRGVSMQPMLRNGRDTVTLSPVTGPLSKYDIPLYRRPDGHFVLHRIVRVGEGDYTCIGDNQFVYEPHVAHSSVLARVTAFTRKGRSWSVDSPVYRLYCRGWHYSRPLRRLARGVLNRLRRSLKG